jgi:hypothetical protein
MLQLGGMVLPLMVIGGVGREVIHFVFTSMWEAVKKVGF